MCRLSHIPFAHYPAATAEEITCLADRLATTPPLKCLWPAICNERKTDSTFELRAFRRLCFAKEIGSITVTQTVPSTRGFLFN